MNAVRRRLTAYALTLGTAALVVHAAVVHVPYPLAGDQALFLYAAERMAQGDRLYVEFWDVKQPGIYWFYQTAGSLFGWSLEGLHRLEALWMLALAALAWWTARRWGASVAVACLAPLACVVAFYAAAGAWHLTQIESLVGLPLLVVVAAALLPAESRAQRVCVGLLMGTCAGIVATFKLLLAIVPVGMALLYLLHLRPSRRLRTAAELLVPAAASGALVLLTVAIVHVSQGAGREAAWATFAYPLAAARELPGASVGRLIGAAKWLLGATWPFLPLALLGTVLAGRNASPDRLRPLARTLLIGWIVLAACALLAQRLSWWAYHFAVFFVPVGLLATIGLAALADRLPWNGASRALYLAATVAAGIGVLAQSWRVATKELDPVGAEAAVLQDATRRTLGDTLRGERVYVFGDPRLLLASGGRQAIAVHGWAWELMPDRQWCALPESLRQAAPRAVYVSSFYRELLCRRSPELVDWLRARYRPTPSDATGGVWLLSATQPPGGDDSPEWGCQPGA